MADVFKFRDFAETVRVSLSLTRGDREAVDAANSFEVIHSETGMTREKMGGIFGSLGDPNLIAKLAVLSGKKPPENPEEWSKLAEESRAATEKLKS